MKPSPLRVCLSVQPHINTRKHRKLWGFSFISQSRGPLEPARASAYLYVYTESGFPSWVFKSTVREKYCQCLSLLVQIGACVCRFSPFQRGFPGGAGLTVNCLWGSRFQVLGFSSRSVLRREMFRGWSWARAPIMPPLPDDR